MATNLFFMVLHKSEIILIMTAIVIPQTVTLFSIVLHWRCTHNELKVLEQFGCILVSLFENKLSCLKFSRNVSVWENFYSECPKKLHKIQTRRTTSWRFSLKNYENYCLLSRLFQTLSLQQTIEIKICALACTRLIRFWKFSVFEVSN